MNERQDGFIVDQHPSNSRRFYITHKNRTDCYLAKDGTWHKMASYFTKSRVEKVIARAKRIPGSDGVFHQKSLLTN